MNIKVDDFNGSPLVNFGGSWTEPHAFLDDLEKYDTKFSRSVLWGLLCPSVTRLPRDCFPNAAITGFGFLDRAKRMRDRANFDDMVQKKGIPTLLQVLPLSAYQLRSRGNSRFANRKLPGSERKRAYLGIVTTWRFNWRVLA